jgi:oligosaccharide repeat unit polymerase
LGAYIIGRTSEDFLDEDMVMYIWDSLSVYIGAPLKLLDLYLYTDYTDVTNMPLGFATFQNIYSWIALKLNIVNWQVINLGLEFRVDNFAFLGNVYTTFRPFMMDFGFIGVVFFSSIMGAFSAVFYYLIKYKRSLWNRSNIDYYTIFYGYLFCQILFSFFANRFYNNIFSFNMMKNIILCFIFEYIFIKSRKEEKL